MFDELRRRSRQHVLPALKVSAKARNHGDKRHRRRDTVVGGFRLGIALKRSRRASEYRKQRGAQNPYRHERGKRHPEHSPRALFVAAGKLYRNQPRDCDGQSAARHREKQRVQRKNQLIQAHSLAAQHVGERHAVHRAQKLGYHRRNRKHACARE